MRSCAWHSRTRPAIRTRRSRSPFARPKGSRTTVPWSRATRSRSSRTAQLRSRLSMQLSLSPDLKRLRDEGYEVRVTEAGHLVVSHVPYANADREIAY